MRCVPGGLGNFSSPHWDTVYRTLSLEASSKHLDNSKNNHYPSTHPLQRKLCLEQKVSSPRLPLRLDQIQVRNPKAARLVEFQALALSSS